MSADPKPEPCAWADDVAALGQIGLVQSARIKALWERGAYGTDAERMAAHRLTNPLCTLAAAETYAAALAEKARQDERERIAEFARSNPGLFASFADADDFALRVLAG
jgi:hypothetical protein